MKIFQEEECDLQSVQELGGNPVCSTRMYIRVSSVSITSMSSSIGRHDSKDVRTYAASALFPVESSNDIHTKELVLSQLSRFVWL